MLPPPENFKSILQSHYARPVTSSSSLPSAVSGPLTDISSHTAQLGLPGSNFQGGLPLYQPGGNLGSWGAAPPPPNANGAGLAMPMYWQGYYGPTSGLPHMHQQSLLRPPPGLSMPVSMPQPMPYPNFNPPLLNGAPSLPEVPSPLLSASSTSSPSLTSTSVTPSTLASALPAVPPSSLASETLSSSVPNKAPNSSISGSTFIASLPSLSPLTTSSDISTILPPITNKPNPISGQTLPYQTVSQSTSSVVGPSTSVRTETPAPSLVTPGQLLQSAPAAVSSPQPLQTVHKDVEVVQVSASSAEVLAPVLAEPQPQTQTQPQPPILPLPTPARAAQKVICAYVLLSFSLSLLICGTAWWALVLRNHDENVLPVFGEHANINRFIDIILAMFK